MPSAASVPASASAAANRSAGGSATASAALPAALVPLIVFPHVGAAGDREPEQLPGEQAGGRGDRGAEAPQQESRGQGGQRGGKGLESGNGTNHRAGSSLAEVDALLSSGRLS